MEALLIRSAAFSATMMVGAFVLPRGTAGITEASDDAQPLDAAHPELGVDDRVIAGAHRAGRRGW